MCRVEIYCFALTGLMVFRQFWSPKSSPRPLVSGQNANNMAERLFDWSTYLLSKGVDLCAAVRSSSRAARPVRLSIPSKLHYNLKQIARNQHAATRLACVQDALDSTMSSNW